ncbi:MAG: sugar ABC transporter permease [Actinomycetaceae bacterium]|nr:sugar ABC transporter permease [Actinomycetaceae bacterium]
MAKRGHKDTRTLRDTMRALPWLFPVLLLIASIVVYPTGVMIFNSTRKISRSGVDKGPIGFENYHKVLENAALPRVLMNTTIWVISIVVLTIVISLALAQFLNKPFPGRRLVRIAVIVPWAASVVMTTTTIYYGLEPKFGIIQQLFHDLGFTSSIETGFTKQPLPAFIIAIMVAVFVSLPFTTYTILAGLQSVPKDVLEAARVDGAGRMRTYFSIVLPQLRPAVATAATINIINVFNNLPILKVLTGAIPGNKADTTTTLIFKMIEARGRIDLASALSVINFLIVLVLIAIYLVVVKPMKGVDE